jgi:hypothetical protein
MLSYAALLHIASGIFRCSGPRRGIRGGPPRRYLAGAHQRRIAHQPLQALHSPACTHSSRRTRPRAWKTPLMCWPILLHP